MTFSDEVAILIILKYEESQLCWRACIASQSISNMTYFDVAFINEVVILIILKLTDTASSWRSTSKSDLLSNTFIHQRINNFPYNEDIPANLHSDFSQEISNFESNLSTAMYLESDLLHSPAINFLLRACKKYTSKI